MAAKRADLPTESELEILKVLWQRGPSTVRQVFNQLEETRDIGYSTVLKFMQIMTEKGSVVRDERVRPQIYRAARSERQTQRGILRDVVNRAFDGSPGNMVLQALSSRKTSAEERRQIRELLDQQESEG